MYVRLLGPIDVTLDGVPEPVRGPRRKALLAVLALYCGQIVGVDRLVDAVWGDDASRIASNTLQSHISYLRRLLGSRTAIFARTPGYVLDLGPEGTDVQLAERLIRQGREATDPAVRVSRLEAALALWRGRPLADVASSGWLAEQADRLAELRSQATRTLVDARLALGEDLALVPELVHMAEDHPFDEQIHGRLMLALYRGGRRSEAIAAYDRLRRALADELGIDPGQPVRDLYAGIVRQDPALAVPPVAGPAAVPTQLPTAVPIVGRAAELSTLDSLPPGTVCVLAGTAGVGKTALAVHWAHRVANRFVDGRLYVNLHGYDASGSPTSPVEALRGLLGALGISTARMPVGLPALTGLYRSLLTGRRVLVVLDNARDDEQVRPLLPGTPGCQVLITSRNQLTGLVAAENAHPLTLDLLTSAESRELLGRRLGATRVAAEPEAVEAIVNRCAGLPLALAVTAASATRATLATTAAALEASTLDTLCGDEPATDLREVFAWSYRTLSAAAARLCRLVGRHPEPDIDVSAVTSLAGVSGRRGHTLVAELTRAHLLDERLPGRYSCHALLRAYANELAEAHETERARQRAAVPW